MAALAAAGVPLQAWRRLRRRRRTAARRAAAPAAPKPPAVVIPPGVRRSCCGPNGAPGSEARKAEPEQIDGETVLNVHNPSIIAFLPRKETATGVAIVMAPGGGHRSLWIMHEGVNPALALNDKGIAVFVLKNRLQTLGLHLRRRRAGRHAAGDPHRAEPGRRVGRRSRRRSARPASRPAASWRSWRRCGTTPASRTPPILSSELVRVPTSRC